MKLAAPLGGLIWKRRHGCGRLLLAIRLAQAPQLIRSVGPTRLVLRQEGRLSRGIMTFMRLVEAHYEDGLLRPTEPLALRPGERVNLIVVRRPDPSRWNLDRLAKIADGGDLTLAEQGLADWAETLDTEDRR